MHKLFRSEGELEALYAEHAGKYKALKDALLADILAFVQPMRAKYDELQKNPEIVEKVLAEGAASIAARVDAKMKAVKAATGLH